MITFRVEVGQKGRALLPAGLRRASGISEGTELVAQVVSEGEVLLSTRRAVLRRIQGAAPQDAGAVQCLEEVRRGELDRTAALTPIEAEGDGATAAPAVSRYLLQNLGLGG